MSPESTGSGGTGAWKVQCGSEAMNSETLNSPDVMRYQQVPGMLFVAYEQTQTGRESVLVAAFSEAVDLVSETNNERNTNGFSLGGLDNCHVKEI